MKTAVLLLLLAGPVLQFEITDARGRPTSSVSIDPGVADGGGWHTLGVVAKGRGEPVMVWPFDRVAKVPDGPAPVPAIVIQRGDRKALATPRVMAAIATPLLLGISTLDELEKLTGVPAPELARAFSGLASATPAFERGVGLLYADMPADAAGSLAVALKERQRVLTRVPSEIYPVALLYGKALSREHKFDEAATAFLAAIGQRPSSELARGLRREALILAGKSEAAEQDIR